MKLRPTSRVLARMSACALAAHLVCIPSASAQESSAAGAPEGAKPGQKKETITVTAGRPSSLPAYIATTQEGIAAEDISEKVNATDAQDALKYLPSLLVRKRYIGDFDHAVLSTRASGTGNSARSLVYADGVLLSNLLGNGASFTPRWGLVAPEEIERVDVLYGPFSAAYPGNSVGAVVDYITRMPQRLEGSVKLAGFSQSFSLYNTAATYRGSQVSANVGNRHDAFSWWLSVNRLDSDGQPLVFATKLQSTATAVTNGVPVTGAVDNLNPRNQPQWLTAATSQINTVQENAKLKLAYDFSPTLRLTYLVAQWRNDAVRSADPYLRNAQGAPVYSGNVVIAGRQYSLAPTEISVSRQDLAHLMQGLTLKTTTRANFDWELAVSRYDYRRDLSRAPTITLPLAFDGGAGRITDASATGWQTLAAKGVWRSDLNVNRVGAHLVDFGITQDEQKLRTTVSDTPDWIRGGAAARFSAFRGDTKLQALYAQDTMRLTQTLRGTLGARFERWQANNGALSNATTTQFFANRRETNISPKFAIAWEAHPEWVLKASLGRAYRYPTVSELYQGTISTNTIVNNDPNLKVEKSWTAELNAEHTLAARSWIRGGGLRLTPFFETTRDALYSQTNVTVFPNVTNIQNVDEVRTKGVETALQLSDFLVKRIDLSASYTFADSRITRNDKNPATVGKWQLRVPRHRANLLVTWRANEQVSATLGVRSSSKQFNTIDNADPNGGAYTGVSPFTVIDLRFQYRPDKKWTFSVGVDNLTNYTYWNFHPYPQRTLLADLKWAF